MSTSVRSAPRKSRLQSTIALSPPATSQGNGGESATAAGTAGAAADDANINEGDFGFRNRFFRFQGETVDGKPDGEGILRLANDITIQGCFVRGELKGPGTKRWPDGSVFFGNFVNGEPHGYGRHISTTLQQDFEGQYEQGYRRGYGVLVDHRKGVEYRGDFYRDFPHGKGILSAIGGTTISPLSIKGYWRAGKLHGMALATFANCDTIVGVCDGGLWTGEAAFYSAQTRLSYKGPFVNGLRRDIPQALLFRNAALLRNHSPLEVEFLDGDSDDEAAEANYVRKVGRPPTHNFTTTSLTPIRLTVMLAGREEPTQTSSPLRKESTTSNNSVVIARGPGAPSPSPARGGGGASRPGTGLRGASPGARARSASPAAGGALSRALSAVRSSVKLLHPLAVTAPVEGPSQPVTLVPQRSETGREIAWCVYRIDEYLHAGITATAWERSLQQAAVERRAQRAAALHEDESPLSGTRRSAGAGSASGPLSPTGSAKKKSTRQSSKHHDGGGATSDDASSGSDNDDGGGSSSSSDSDEQDVTVRRLVRDLVQCLERRPLPSEQRAVERRLASGEGTTAIVGKKTKTKLLLPPGVQQWVFGVGQPPPSVLPSPRTARALTSARGSSPRSGGPTPRMLSPTGDATRRSGGGGASPRGYQQAAPAPSLLPKRRLGSATADQRKKKKQLQQQKKKLSQAKRKGNTNSRGTLTSPKRKASPEGTETDAALTSGREPLDSPRAPPSLPSSDDDEESIAAYDAAADAFARLPVHYQELFQVDARPEVRSAVKDGVTSTDVFFPCSGVFLVMAFTKGRVPCVPGEGGLERLVTPEAVEEGASRVSASVEGDHGSPSGMVSPTDASLAATRTGSARGGQHFSNTDSAPPSPPPGQLIGKRMISNLDLSTVRSAKARGGSVADTSPVSRQESHHSELPLLPPAPLLRTRSFFLFVAPDNQHQHHAELRPPTAED